MNKNKKEFMFDMEVFRECIFGARRGTYFFWGANKIEALHDVSDNLRHYDNRELQPVEKNHYRYLSDKLNACNDLIDKLHNWGI